MITSITDTPLLFKLIVRPNWFVNRYVKSVLEEYFDFTGKEVLDFGCGVGSTSFMFRPDRYIGVDCDAKRIGYAQKTFQKYRFIGIDNNKLPLQTNSVDYVLILSVIHHICDKDFEIYLNEFQRVLKTDGVILAIEPCLYPEHKIGNFIMNTLDKGAYIRDEGAYLNLFHQQNYATKTLKRYSQNGLYHKLFFTAKPTNYVKT